MGLVTMAAGAAIRSAQNSQRAQAAPRHPGTVAVRTSAQMATVQREHIDGAALLTQVCAWLKRYLYLDSDSKYWALTLWIAGSHFRDERGYLVHEAFPIAGFFSDEPGSGKTHALECLSILCPEAPGILVEPSEAAVALLIAKHHRTILLDEGDILFGAGRRKAAIRAMLNSGYKKGGTWDRVRKGDVESVRTDGAKAIAALKVMMTGTGSSLDALGTRIVEFDMCKPPPGVVVCKLREVLGVHPETGPITGRHAGERLRDKMAAWACQERGAVAGAIPQMPEGVRLRDEEKWAAALAVGARAEANRQDREDEDKRGEGDNWAHLAWAACVDMSLYGGIPDVTEPEPEDGEPGSRAAAVDDVLDGLAIFAPEDAPPSLPQDPPAAVYRARCAVTFPGFTPASREIPGDWQALEDAQAACEEVAGQAFDWQPSRKYEGHTVAMVETEDGTKWNYAVAMISDEGEQR